VHAVAATAAQIAEAIRAYNQQLAEHTLYHRVATKLKAQILTAIEATYLRELEDADFGFADVTPQEMLQHLQTSYAVLTPEALEANRTSLSDPWNPDEPLENSFHRQGLQNRTYTTLQGWISSKAPTP
jgi:hypothetical protein